MYGVERGAELAEPARDLPVGGQHVDVPREPQHRRLAAQVSTERRDRHHGHLQQSESQRGSKALTTPSTGSSMYVPPSAVCGPCGGDDRHRHQRDRRHPRVDERHSIAPAPTTRRRSRRRQLEVGREVGGRLDAGERERRDHQGLDEVLGARRRVNRSTCAVSRSGGRRRSPRPRSRRPGARCRPARARSAAAGGRALVKPPMLIAAASAITATGDDDLGPAVGESARDRPEVMRHRDRRERDRR